MSGEEKEKGFRGRVKGAAAQAGILIGLVTGLKALIEQEPTESRPFLLAIGAIAAGALWWFLFHIATSKESHSRHDPEKKRYVHSKLRRIGAVSGLVIIPVTIGLVITIPIPSPPTPNLKLCLTVAIARFKNDTGDFRTILVERLKKPNEYSSDIRLRPWELEFEVASDENVDVKARGFGHILIWGGVARDLGELWLKGVVIQKCGRPMQSQSAEAGAGSGSIFSVPVKFGGASQPTGDQMNDFVRFITGVALYEEGRFRESAELFESIDYRDATLFKGMAYQQIAVSSSKPKDDLLSAIHAYQEFVGADWVMSAEDKKNPDVAGNALVALINAGNATLESSNYDPGDAGRYVRNAILRYKGAIGLYEYLLEQNIKLPDEQQNTKIEAQTNLAIAKAQFANTGNQDNRRQWLEEAEEDLTNLLGSLEADNQANSQEWINAKANLGSVRIDLSRISDNPDNELKRAQRNFQKALDASVVVPSAASFLQRASLRAKIGRVLIDRAENSDSAEKASRYLDHASECFKKAGEYLSQGGASDSFDAAQNSADLGLVSLARGNKLSATQEAIEKLQDASAFFTNSLKGLDQRLHPVDWALTTNNLARAERELGIRLADADEKRKHLLRSVQLCADSLELFGHDDTPHWFLRFYWALVKRTEGDCLIALGKETPGDTESGYTLQAVDAYQKALSVWAAANFQNDLRKTCESLAGTGTQPILGCN
jgi:hypothetical protein